MAKRLLAWAVIVHNGPMTSAGFSHVDATEAGGGSAWWDADAAQYYADHGAHLGDADLLWCPEGVRESEAGLLGDVRGRRVLEVGCGAAQGSRWTMTAGAHAVGLDFSRGMLRVGRELNRRTGIDVPLVLGDARALPFADGAFDLAFSAFGALAFVPELGAVHREVARVLRPGGRWVLATTHPMRWCFPDDPGVDQRALTVVRAYFDATPYAEREGGQLVYAEFPHTVAEHINSLVDAGFAADRAWEPRPEPGQAIRWGAWSPERGALIPGTLILAASRATPPR
ncbi:MAG: class I SAM-dependent methyltransferase [Bifidobacteriaceae bacterium]|jgi:ubiquinone/menaquinone biosynthesis C-methylase UbiE|nr:class I SAM-dependent methyltransferase [Bifidobacteriaceae bacterium]